MKKLTGFASTFKDEGGVARAPVDGSFPAG